MTPRTIVPQIAWPTPACSGLLDKEELRKLTPRSAITDAPLVKMAARRSSNALNVKSTATYIIARNMRSGHRIERPPILFPASTAVVTVVISPASVAHSSAPDESITCQVQQQCQQEQ